MKFIVQAELIIEAHDLQDVFKRLGTTIPALGKNAADFESSIERGRLEIKEDDGTLQVVDKYKDFKATFEGNIPKIVEHKKNSYLLIKTHNFD